MQTANEKDDYLQSFRDGEERGFTYYFEALYPAMLFYAFRLVKNKPAAENIVEESFINLWEKHGAYETEKEIRQVLYNKVGTAAKTWICRQGNGHAKHMESDSHLPDLIRTEVTRKLYAAIRKLPPFYKQVFKLIVHTGQKLKGSLRGTEHIREYLKRSPVDRITVCKEEWAAGVSEATSHWPLDFYYSTFIY